MQLTVLNFDNVYQYQPFLQHEDTEWINLMSIPNTNLFCEKKTLQEIAKRLFHHQLNNITLIGSGNYHYMTYVLLNKIKKPFTLILFDHHTDTLKSPSEDLISCGSWVLDSLNNLPYLKKVLIIGVSEEGEQHIPPSIEEKVILYSKHYLRLNFKKALAAIIRDISTEEVYISIDKDVLDKKEAMTTWDHGNMRLRQLLIIVKVIFQTKTVNGLDICGEYPVNSNEFGQTTKEAINKNNEANKLLLRYIQHWWSQTKGYSEFLHA